MPYLYRPLYTCFLSRSHSTERGFTRGVTQNTKGTQSCRRLNNKTTVKRQRFKCKKTAEAGLDENLLHSGTHAARLPFLPHIRHGSFCERIGVGVASAARNVSAVRAVHFKTSAGQQDSQIGLLAYADADES